MRRLLPLPALLACLLWPLAALADLAVIVHPDNPVQALTQKQVSDLYLGRTRHFSVAESTAPIPATVYELPPDSPLRESFFHALNGMPIKQINAYWARLRYSGEVLPPPALPDSRSVLQAVSHDRNAIGYVDAATVDHSVKVVLRLKE
ncbi:MAG TPA: hypothetical protein VI279_02775 [Rhodocyclaceae bacterium]